MTLFCDDKATRPPNMVVQFQLISVVNTYNNTLQMFLYMLATLS